MDRGESGKKITKQRLVEIMLVAMVFTGAFVLLFDVIPFEYSMLKTIACESLIFLLVAFPSLLAYKYQGDSLNNLKGFKVKEIGIIFGLLVFRALLAFVLDLAGIQNIGMAKIWNPIMPFVYLVYYVFVVAVCEEFIFRIYIQETFERLLGNRRVLAPVCAGLLFGAFHLITGDMTNAIVSAFLGIIWGYVRYAGTSFMAMVMIHGLSNYLLYVMALIMGFRYGIYLM